jgi:hypothetical protein
MHAREREMSDYSQRQAEKNTGSKKEYAAWVAQLSPADNGSAPVGFNGDIAESPPASEEPDLWDVCDSPEPSR